jgi:putative acetyltransferase
MEVREATPADAEEIAAIIAVVAEEGSIATEAPVDVAARAEALRAELSGDGPTGGWVLVDDGKIVGTGGLHATGIDGVLSLGISLLPGSRGRGGGRALLEALVDAAERSGAHKLELECWPDNSRAVALYARHGFAVEGLRRNHYRRRDGSLRSSLLMARLLGGSASG